MATKRARMLGVLAAGAVTVGIGLSPVAAAQQYPPTTTRGSTQSTPPTFVTQKHHRRHHRPSLPFTGGDIAGLTAIGAGAIGGGVALVRSGRRRGRRRATAR